jgi:nucleotide-binding universal stress UspA family protein
MSKMYKKILVPLDGSELAECVLPHVESIAKGCGVQDVVFLHVVEPVTVTSALGPYLSEQDMQDMNSRSSAAAEKYLSELVNHKKYGAASIRSEVMVGRAADSIADYASKNGVDLIIIATHGRSGVSRWVWGNVADRVLRSACVPVLMVRAPGCVPGI